jgi:hypothetical protein
VRDGDDLEIAEHWLEQARRELDDDFAAYCREWPTGGKTVETMRGNMKRVRK